MATFCFCPPESVAMSRERRSAMPQAPRAQARRASTWSRGTPKFSSPKRSSSSTPAATIWESMSCRTDPTTRETSVRPTSQVSMPSMVAVPRKVPAKW